MRRGEADETIRSASPGPSGAALHCFAFGLNFQTAAIVLATLPFSSPACGRGWRGPLGPSRVRGLCSHRHRSSRAKRPLTRRVASPLGTLSRKRERIAAARGLIRISNSPPRSRERMRSEVCGSSPSRGEGGGAPRRRWCGSLPHLGGPPRGRADLRSAGDRRSMTGAPPGAPPRRFLSSGHASRQATFDRDLTSASSWRGALSGAQVGSEGLPGPGVRDLCAGAAPCSISKTPPEDALSEQDEAIMHIFRGMSSKIPIEDSIFW